MSGNAHYRVLPDSPVKRASAPSVLAHSAIDGRCLLATFRNVAIAAWFEAAPHEAIVAASGMIERLASACPKGIAFLQLMEADSQRLDEPARQALRALLLAARDSIREAQVVYEGTGFRAAEVRATMTGLLPSRSLSFPLRVYTTVQDASLAIARAFEKHEPTRFARELCDVVATLRERHQCAFPSAPLSSTRSRK